MSHTLVVGELHKPWRMTAAMRISTVAFCGLLIVFAVLSIPDVVFTYYLESTAPPIIETYRGTVEATQSIETLREEVKDYGRRLNVLENQQAAVRLAVIESKLGTMFDLGRIILGAAIMYILEVLFRGLKWATGKSKIGG